MDFWDYLLLFYYMFLHIIRYKYIVFPPQFFFSFIHVIEMWMFMLKLDRAMILKKCRNNKLWHFCTNSWPIYNWRICYSTYTENFIIICPAIMEKFIFSTLFRFMALLVSRHKLFEYYNWLKPYFSTTVSLVTTSTGSYWKYFIDER